MYISIILNLNNFFLTISFIDIIFEKKTNVLLKPATFTTKDNTAKEEL